MKEKIFNLIAGNYFSGTEEGNYYAEYLRLKALIEEDKSNRALLACYEADVWELIDDWVVGTLVDTIEDQVRDIESLIKNVLNESPIGGIDFTQLKEQKRSLIDIIHFNDVGGESELINNLTGILHLIDSIQDYAVDTMGEKQSDVFDIEEE